MTSNHLHQTFIRRTFELAAQAVEKGNHPFGALLVHHGKVVVEAENTVNTEKDPTGHAETNLVRKAARQFSREALAECVLYTSTEPCMMCSAAMYWAGISMVVYGCAESGLAQYSGGDFLTPCREVFAKGQRPVTVIGPVLPDEGIRLHADFW